VCETRKCLIPVARLNAGPWMRLCRDCKAAALSGDASAKPWPRKGQQGVGKWERGREKRSTPAKASLLGTSPAHDSPLAVARRVAGGFATPTSPIRIGIRAQANSPLHRRCGLVEELRVIVQNLQLEGAGTLGSLEKARWAVPLPMPVSRQIVLEACPGGA